MFSQKHTNVWFYGRKNLHMKLGIQSTRLLAVFDYKMVQYSVKHFCCRRQRLSTISKCNDSVQTSSKPRKNVYFCKP